MDRALAPLRCDTRYFARRCAWSSGIRTRAKARHESALHRARTARGLVLALSSLIDWNVADILHPRRNITITFTVEETNG